LNPNIQLFLITLTTNRHFTMRATYPIPVVIIVLAILFFADFNLSSCTKTKTNTVTVYDTTVVVVKDTITVAPKPSVLSLLTGTYWETDSALGNYTGPGTGVLVYARGASNNTLNVSNYYYTWATNGIEWAVENGTYYQFQWSIVNGDSSLLKMSTSSFTDYARILSASSTKVIIYDSSSSYLNTLIPVP
jgi:hypothetical protein